MDIRYPIFASAKGDAPPPADRHGAGAPAFLTQVRPFFRIGRMGAVFGLLGILLGGCARREPAAPGDGILRISQRDGKYVMS